MVLVSRTAEDKQDGTVEDKQDIRQKRTSRQQRTSRTSASRGLADSKEQAGWDSRG